MVARRASGVMSSLPPILAFARSISTTKASSGGYVFRYDLDASGLAISELRCGMFLGPRNLLPSMCNRANPRRGRTKGVSKGYIFSMGEQLLRRLGIPSLELIYRQAPLLEYLVEIIYRGHL
jgi:hypothetical protein